MTGVPKTKPKGTKRNKKYFVQRLIDEHPEFALRVKKGELTLSEAFYQSGLRKRPPHIQALRRAWRNASAKERQEFLTELGPDQTGLDAPALQQFWAAFEKCSQNEKLAILRRLLPIAEKAKAVKVGIETAASDS